MRTVVLTSDKHSWLLRGFFHQWEKYRGHNGYVWDWFDVEVAGFTNPGFLPADVPFYSIGKFEDYPVDRWSDAVIQYLHSIKDEFVLLLLEDYWMLRPINREAIFNATRYMLNNPDVIRFDLAADRMFAKNARYIGSYGQLDICECKGDYSLSTQASIFRREMLIEVLRPGETPWQSELNGTDRLNKLPYRVVGSYQWPMNYAIVMNKGKLDVTGEWMYPARTLKQDDWRNLAELGYLNPEALSEHAL